MVVVVFPFTWLQFKCNMVAVVLSVTVVCLFFNTNETLFFLGILNVFFLNFPPLFIYGYKFPFNGF